VRALSPVEPELRPRRRAVARWGGALGAAAFYATAAVLLTWPLFRRPASTVVSAAADVLLTVWILAWDVHALVTRPLELFHANIFYPARYTLALAEHLLGNLPAFAPVYLLTGNPVLAHEATLLASFVIAGLAMAAYVLHWTRDGGAALAAGFLYAFAPFRLWQMIELHYIAIQWLPLVALAIDLVLHGARPRAAAVGLAGVVLVSSLCSYYVGYATFLLAAIYTASAVRARGRPAMARLALVAVALVAAAGVVALVSVPYLYLRRAGIIPDYAANGFASLGFIGMAVYGLFGQLAFYVLSQRGPVPEFLTYTGLALALVGILRRRGHPRGGLLAVAVLGLLLSLGHVLAAPWTRPIPLPYAWLAAVVPGFSSMRLPQRFGALVTLATAAFAGFGLATLRRALMTRGRGGAARVLPALVILLLAVEVRPPPITPATLPVGPAIPPAYGWLAAHGEGAALLELPTAALFLERQAFAMYYSTAHWLPLANGYSAYPPHPYVDIIGTLEQMPRADALDAILAALPVRWVLVHREAILPSWWPRWEVVLEPRLQRVAEFGEAVLFEVPARPPDARGPVPSGQRVEQP